MARRSEQTIFLRRGTDGQQAHEKILSITVLQGITNQNHSELSPHLLEWLLPKKQEITSVGEDVEKRKPLSTVGGNVN